jgi:hypothetical protein
VINVTAEVRQWILSSNDIWIRWFSSRVDGATEFSEIESLLLKVMVYGHDPLLSNDSSKEQFFARLQVIYPASIAHEERQFCVVQRSGNIFCRSQVVNIIAGSRFNVKSIDTTGAISNGEANVEIAYDGGYLLESPELIDFVIAS